MTIGVLASGASEFLICGVSAETLGERLRPLGVSVFDPSGIHQRLVAANDAAEDPSRLQVPIVPGSIWTRLTQVVSKQRSAALRWAVAADDLELFVPVWAYLMPAANVVTPAGGSVDRADQVEQLVKELL